LRYIKECGEKQYDIEGKVVQPGTVAEPIRLVSFKAGTAHRGVWEQWHTEGEGLNPPSKFRSFDKAEPNSQFHGKYNLIRIQVSPICKLSRTPD
jgi:hypothetical protein